MIILQQKEYIPKCLILNPNRVAAESGAGMLCNPYILIKPRKKRAKHFLLQT
jgi:hypothetical protein